MEPSPPIKHTGTRKKLLKGSIFMIELPRGGHGMFMLERSFCVGLRNALIIPAEVPTIISAVAILCPAKEPRFVNSDGTPLSEEIIIAKSTSVTAIFAYIKRLYRL